MPNIVVVGMLFSKSEPIGSSDQNLIKKIKEVIESLGKGYEKETVVTYLLGAGCVELASPAQVSAHYFIVRDTDKNRAQEIACFLHDQFPYADVEVEIILAFLQKTN